MADKKELKKGLISVVMSNYNTPIKYLKESIDSVLDQTYSNFELIIIDDGSTDDSLEFIKSYDDPRIKLIVNEENIGLANSLNEGLEVASGEFIARMDTDDICYPERFDKQIKYMQENPNTIVCGTWAKTINSQNQWTGETWASPIIKDTDSYRISLLFSNNPLIIHPSAFFNNKLLLKYNLKYSNLFPHAEDYELWTRCSKVSNCFILQEKLLQFRRHNESISGSYKKIQTEEAYSIVQTQLEELGLHLSDDIKELHYRLLVDIKPYDNTLRKWIKKIITANKEYRIYHQKKLKRILWYRWSELCYEEMSNSNITRILYLFLSLSMRCKLYLFMIRIKSKKGKNE